MDRDCKYEVHTRWGMFLLDEGAYRDYVAGRLWIGWEPGKARRTVSDGTPANVSPRALRFREQAAKSDAYTVCSAFFSGGSVGIPYRSRMRETPIGEMYLSVRSSNGLMRAGADSFGRVKQLLEQENGLRNVHNLGIKSEKEIRLCFFNACYALLDEYEKAAWWQETINRNDDGAQEMA